MGRGPPTLAPSCLRSPKDHQGPQQGREEQWEHQTILPLPLSSHVFNITSVLLFCPAAGEGVARKRRERKKAEEINLAGGKTCPQKVAGLGLRLLLTLQKSAGGKSTHLCRCLVRHTVTQTSDVLNGFVGKAWPAFPSVPSAGSPLQHCLPIRHSLELFRLVNLPASHIFSPSVSRGFAFIGTVLYACRHLSTVHLPLLFMIFRGRWYKLQKCLISGMHFILMEDYMTGAHFITSCPAHSSITSPIC